MWPLLRCVSGGKLCQQWHLRQHYSSKLIMVLYTILHWHILPLKSNHEISKESHPYCTHIKLLLLILKQQMSWYNEMLGLKRHLQYEDKKEGRIQRSIKFENWELTTSNESIESKHGLCGHLSSRSSSSSSSSSSRVEWPRSEIYTTVINQTLTDINRDGFMSRGMRRMAPGQSTGQQDTAGYGSGRLGGYSRA